LLLPDRLKLYKARLVLRFSIVFLVHQISPSHTCPAFLDFFFSFFIFLSLSLSLSLSLPRSVPTLGVRAIKNRLQRATSARPNKRNTRDPSHKKIKKRGIKKSRPGSAPARQTPTRRQQQQSM
jgi:hypothetical protein